MPPFLLRPRSAGLTPVETLIAGVVILIIAFPAEFPDSSIKLSTRVSNRLAASASFPPSSASPPPDALDALRYSAATSPVQGENLARLNAGPLPRRP
jgi:hypothetical protein